MIKTIILFIILVGIFPYPSQAEDILAVPIGTTGEPVSIVITPTISFGCDLWVRLKEGVDSGAIKPSSEVNLEELGLRLRECQIGDGQGNY